MKRGSSIFRDLVKGDVGRGVYEAEGTTKLKGMIPIDGVHNQCNLIFAQAMRRICGDYMENKCEIIPDGLDEDIDALTENILSNKKLMSLLNQTIAEEYAALYGDDITFNIDGEYDEPSHEPVKQVKSNRTEPQHEIVEMDYFDR